MKKIITFIQVLICVAIFSSITSCGDDGMEIVSQNTNWALDDQYIEEDIRQQLGIDPYMNFAYLYYTENPFYALKGVYDLQHVKIEGKTEYAVRVRVTKACQEDLTFKLVRSDNEEDIFPATIDKYAALSEVNYTLGTTVLKAGEKETTLTFSLKDIDNLKESPGYALTLNLEIEGSHGGLFVSEIRSTIFLKLDVEIRLDNIDSGNQEIAGELFNKNVTFDSNNNQSALSYLNDGDTSSSYYSSYWYASEAKDGYLDMILSEANLLKGFRINGDILTCTVLVDSGDGTLINHGIFKITKKSAVQYIAFKEPTLCTKIRLTDIKTDYGSSYFKMYEMNLIK